MITAAEMRRLERYATSRGIMPQELMENAGKQVFQVVKNKYLHDKMHVVVFAGEGNNGGDGFVAARHFAERCPTVVLFFGSPDKLSEESLENYELLKKKVTVVNISKHQDVHKFRFQTNLEYLFIDALIGTGLKNKVQDSFAIDYFNQQKGIKVSVDVPSGLHPDTGEAGKICDCDLIVTFHDLKTGLEKFKEKTVVVDIGIPEHK